MISVIVPLYNEGEAVHRLIDHLRQINGLAEVVLVDASDEPKSVAVRDELSRQLENDSFIRVLTCDTAGRAAQMNAGANQCSGTVLLFLHCDTRLPLHTAQSISQCIADGRAWGWFNLRLDARGGMYRVLETMINLRSRLSRIATGDQAIFIQRHTFEKQLGFAEIALMEDIELSRRLKRLSKPGIIAQPVVTSARRWQQNGLLRTILFMWKLRFLYWLGGSPERLAARYQNVR